MLDFLLILTLVNFQEIKWSIQVKIIHVFWTLHFTVLNIYENQNEQKF